MRQLTGFQVSGFGFSGFRGWEFTHLTHVSWLYDPLPGGHSYSTLPLTRQRSVLLRPPLAARWKSFVSILNAQPPLTQSVATEPQPFAGGDEKLAHSCVALVLAHSCWCCAVSWKTRLLPDRVGVIWVDPRVQACSSDAWSASLARERQVEPGGRDGASGAVFVNVWMGSKGEGGALSASLACSRVTHNQHDGWSLTCE